jgi:hypothetical protein
MVTVTETQYVPVSKTSTEVISATGTTYLDDVQQTLYETLTSVETVKEPYTVTVTAPAAVQTLARRQLHDKAYWLDLLANNETLHNAESGALEARSFVFPSKPSENWFTNLFRYNKGYLQAQCALVASPVRTKTDKVLIIMIWADHSRNRFLQATAPAKLVQTTVTDVEIATNVNIATQTVIEVCLGRASVCSGEGTSSS